MQSSYSMDDMAMYDMDDADVAAGKVPMKSPPSSANSSSTINTKSDRHPTDLEFFDDHVSEPVLVLGVDIGHLSRRHQFMVCAGGNFMFSLTYGYLQELISVSLASRKLGLFLAMMQFSGYTVLAYILRYYVYAKGGNSKSSKNSSSGNSSDAESSSLQLPSGFDNPSRLGKSLQPHHVPFIMYLAMSLLRAVDMAMTNLAMQYINYPAKTLMKSSKTVWTMLFGVVIARKRYAMLDYAIVLCMVAGLALFLHADASSAAVFDGRGVAMLTVSLLCDGAIANMSETIMRKYGVGQDEFIFRMYSIALVAITFAAAFNGDLAEGMRFMRTPGTYEEMTNGTNLSLREWSVVGKISVLLLFSSMGFFGSSCSAAITKNFGALTMSITSTARKATTLFLSFFLFRNVCTFEHVCGIVLFISALTTKSVRRGRDGKGKRKQKGKRGRRATATKSLSPYRRPKPKSSNNLDYQRIPPAEDSSANVRSRGHGSNNNATTQTVPVPMASIHVV